MEYSDSVNRLIVRHLQTCMDGVAGGEWIARAMGLNEDGTPNGPVIAVISADLWPEVEAVIAAASGGPRLHVDPPDLDDGPVMFDPDSMMGGG